MRTNRFRVWPAATGIALVVLLLGACARTGGGSPSDSSSPDACRTSPVDLAIALNTPAPSVCVHVGALLNVASEANRLQPWLPVQSSDPQVISCTSTQHPDGSVSATCTAHRPGAAMLVATTGPFAGDPHGPPQRSWTASVTVVG
jgi:hypothetical protein